MEGTATAMMITSSGRPIRQYSQSIATWSHDDGVVLVFWRTWECVLCGFRYDEALGDPDGGADGETRWEDVPDD